MVGFKDPIIQIDQIAGVDEAVRVQLQSSLQCLDTALRTGRFNTDGNHAIETRTILAICCRGLELTHGISALFARGSMTALPVLIRCLLELVCDAVCIVEDHEFELVLRYRALKDMHMWHKNFGHDCNSESHAVAAKVKVELDAGETRIRFDALKAKQQYVDCEIDKVAGRLKLLERYVPAGNGTLRTHTWSQLYHVFCVDTHNDMKQLLPRHIKTTGQTQQIVVYGNYDPNWISTYMVIVSELSNQLTWCVTKQQLREE